MFAPRSFAVSSILYGSLNNKLDPLTHVLAGAVISRTGLNRKTGLATATLVLSAELPDIDVLLSFNGPVLGFEQHRGFTHTFLGAPVVAGLAIAVAYGIYRLMGRFGRPPKLEPRWGLLYLFALIGALSHILLDFTNNYGTHPFSPFDRHWYGWDIVYIIEPLVPAPLLLALIAPWFAGLIAGEVGARKSAFPGRPSAIAALIFVVALWGVRDFNHRRAIAILSADTYGEEEPVRVSAYPYMLNPFKWLGVVETNGQFASLTLNTWLGEADSQHAVIRHKPEETPVSLAAKNSPLGKVYLDWARYPYVEVNVLSGENGGYVVKIRDLRYDYLESSQRLGRSSDESPLSIRIKLDSQLNVIEQRMGNRIQK